MAAFLTLRTPTALAPRGLDIPIYRGHANFSSLAMASRVFLSAARLMTASALARAVGFRPLYFPSERGHRPGQIQGPTR
jgi:hypothetical protein